MIKEEHIFYHMNAAPQFNLLKFQLLACLNASTHNAKQRTKTKDHCSYLKAGSSLNSGSSDHCFIRNFSFCATLGWACNSDHHIIAHPHGPAIQIITLYHTHMGLQFRSSHYSTPTWACNSDHRIKAHPHVPAVQIIAL